MPRPIPPSSSSPSKPSPYAKPPAASKSSYLLTFGKHQNTPLASLPRAYLTFLLKERAYRNKPDLHQALIDEGFMLEDGSVGPNKPPVTPRKKKEGFEEERKEKLEGWKLPTEREELERNEGLRGGLDDWITAYQAYKKYRISEGLLLAAKLRLYPEDDSKTKRWFEWEVQALSWFLNPRVTPERELTGVHILGGRGRSYEHECHNEEEWDEDE